MISNSLNNSIHRLLLAEKFCLNEIFDEKIENASLDNFLYMNGEIGKNRNLDYDLFKHCIKFKRERFIEYLIDLFF